MTIGSYGFYGFYIYTLLLSKLSFVPVFFLFIYLFFFSCLNALVSAVMSTHGQQLEVRKIFEFYDGSTIFSLSIQTGLRKQCTSRSDAAEYVGV